MCLGPLQDILGTNKNRRKRRSKKPNKYYVLLKCLAPKKNVIGEHDFILQYEHLQSLQVCATLSTLLEHSLQYK